MDKVEIKSGLKHAMEISALANKYMQDEKPWDEANKGNKRYSFKSIVKSETN